MPRMTQAEYQAYLARCTAVDRFMAGHGPEPCADAVPRESDLHEAILDDCRRRGWHAIHSRMDRPTTTGVGDPDFVIMADNGRTFYIEAKSKTGKLTNAQLALAAQASKLGHVIHVVRCMEEYLAVITKKTEIDQSL